VCFVQQAFGISVQHPRLRGDIQATLDQCFADIEIVEGQYEEFECSEVFGSVFVHLENNLEMSDYFPYLKRVDGDIIVIANEQEERRESWTKIFSSHVKEITGWISRKKNYDFQKTILPFKCCFCFADIVFLCGQSQDR